MYIPYLAFGLPLFFRAPLIVPNNAASTAANIIASESLYRLTVVTDLVSYVLYIVLAYLFYTLLREVSRPWATVGTYRGPFAAKSASSSTSALDAFGLSKCET